MKKKHYESVKEIVRKERIKNLERKGFYQVPDRKKCLTCSYVEKINIFSKSNGFCPKCC